jgi:hypothetical protein
MKTFLQTKVFFSEDEERKFVVVGLDSLENFSLRQLYSTQEFPFRKYFSIKKGRFLNKIISIPASIFVSRNKKTMVVVYNYQ